MVEMNLQTSIDAGLWAAVQATYEAGNYTGAILDSIHLLSDLIRNKVSVRGSTGLTHDPVNERNGDVTPTERVLSFANLWRSSKAYAHNEM
jgi:hypothetical protein